MKRSANRPIAFFGQFLPRLAPPPPLCSSNSLDAATVPRSSRGYRPHEGTAPAARSDRPVEWRGPKQTMPGSAPWWTWGRGWDIQSVLSMRTHQTCVGAKAVFSNGGKGGGGRMRRGGTHFWQAPTALDLPREGGGGSAQKAPTHSPTDQRKGEDRGGNSLPLKGQGRAG